MAISRELEMGLLWFKERVKKKGCRGGKIRNKTERKALHAFSHVKNLDSSMYSRTHRHDIKEKEDSLSEEGGLAGVRTRVGEWRVECE